MGYNVSVESIARVEGILKLLLRGTDLELKSPAPARLAYQIREGIHAATQLDIAPYNDLNVSIKTRKDHVAIVHRRDLVTLVKEVTSIQPDQVNEFEVVTFLSKAEDGSYAFPNFNGNVETVARWAEKKYWKLDPGPPLTLRKIDESLS